MIRSMTGYGKAEVVVGDATCTIEARCVNGRYLEVSTKLPREWSDKEALVREVVRTHVSRGSLTVSIRRADVAEQVAIQPNVQVARAYVDALRQIQHELGLSGTVSIEQLVGLPAVFSAPDGKEDDDGIGKALREGLEATMESLNQMRIREGGELVRDLESRLHMIEEGLQWIESTAQQRVEQERVRLRERVAQVLGEAQIDEQRMMLEIVLLSEKLDVTEECVRLRSHIKHMRQYLSGQEQAGRKMNFLLQEMNREVNTIGSKCNHAEVAHIVVGMKEELERMREQVQNVE